MIQKYSNYNGNSPIVGYEIESTRITVWFKGNRSYSYSYVSAGKDNVETMKELAKKGVGLSTFITRNVRYSYE